MQRRALPPADTETVAQIMLDMARADIDQDSLSRLVRNAMLLRA
jgi:hypothetical protein